MAKTSVIKFKNTKMYVFLLFIGFFLGFLRFMFAKQNINNVGIMTLLTSPVLLTNHTTSLVF